MQLSNVTVIADPMRRALLSRIWHQERSVNELVAEFDVTQPAVSFHLRKLREHGLVSVRREGNRRYYRALPDEFGELRGWLEAFWDDRLAQLKDEVELALRNERNRSRRHER